MAKCWAIVCAAMLLLASTAIGVRASHVATLPNDWILLAPQGLMTETDTMPQGAAPSPDDKTLAVVESGFNPPTLRLYGTSDLGQLASIPLQGAFGRPVWIDPTHVLVAGANADALFVVDVQRQNVRSVAMPKNSYPSAVAMFGTSFAVATDGDQSVRIGALDDLAHAKPIGMGGHIGGLTFSADGASVFASNRSGSDVVAIDSATLAKRIIRTGLHPSAVLSSNGLLYVAESDADSVGVYDFKTGQRVASIFLGDRGTSAPLAGVSPNALARQRNTIFVSLGAANSVAIVRDRRVIGRIPTGWYPTDVVPIGQRLFIVSGKGEGTRANPYFDAKVRSFNDYVASIQYGSIRTYDLSRDLSGSKGNPQGARGWRMAGGDSIARHGGPIRHVFFILKENRSYDQVLGDIPQGNGDPKLAWFDARVTPNEHALAARFGLFDNTYASGEVSESGHNWADAAFVNDYVERNWPVIYGDRGSSDDTMTGQGAAVPRNGFIWQAAEATGISFRDYGEMANTPNLSGPGTTTAPSLLGHYDPQYVGWNLDYSDLDRVKEWRREFAAYLRRDDVPQLEYMWLPNDHTYGSRLGKLTPVAYVATNDYALGEIVDAISHSAVWKSSAIFVIEDDAQDGPDHVSDQRTTFFLISPYARGGLQHAHYSTVSILRTMELILGLGPLSTYDAMAVPLSAAFSPVARLAPYSVIAPRVNVTVRNGKNAYGAAMSDHLDFRRPDATSPGTLREIIAHDHAI
jgi:hypothetical protein